eukprot:SAG11_NODE_21154_length_431_cov_0.737952_2_plen_51_part_01
MKESGYYSLSVEQMFEIAKGEEDALRARQPMTGGGQQPHRAVRNFALHKSA